MDKQIVKAIMTIQKHANGPALVPPPLDSSSDKWVPGAPAVSKEVLSDARRTLARMNGLELAEMIIAHQKAGSGVTLFL